MALLLAAATLCTAEDGRLILARNPSVSRTDIVFSYAGSLWVVARVGGEARRLTSAGHEVGPLLSPDGKLVAFTGEYDGNQDVYVVPAAGGEPRRLTYHPGEDEALGWTPDGKQILFRSRRASGTDPAKFFTIPVQGGFPAEVPLPMAEEGSFSPDGSKLAYVPNFQWQDAWKRYRGGQTKHIWIVNLSDSSVEHKIPQENNSNDFCPMWVGSKVYFLSDRHGPVSLFAYNLSTERVAEVVKNKGLDFKSAAAGPDAIVYEQFGSLHLLDLGSGKTRAVQLHVAADLPEVRPHFAKVDPKRS
jgi:tricorn protease